MNWHEEWEDLLPPPVYVHPPWFYRLVGVCVVLVTLAYVLRA